MYTSLASDFSGKFNIHFTWTLPRYIVIGLNRWQKKVDTDFSRIPNCPTGKYGKCMNYKWCCSTELFLIHQMSPSVTLATS